MNTKKQIQEAYKDYYETGFGGWKWGDGDVVHPREVGRFARYPDGREERPDDCIIEKK